MGPPSVTTTSSVRSGCRSRERAFRPSSPHGEASTRVRRGMGFACARRGGQCFDHVRGVRSPVLRARDASRARRLLARASAAITWPSSEVMRSTGRSAMSCGMAGLLTVGEIRPTRCTLACHRSRPQRVSPARALPSSTVPDRTCNLEGFLMSKFDLVTSSSDSLALATPKPWSSSSRLSAAMRSDWRASLAFYEVSRDAW